MLPSGAGRRPEQRHAEQLQEVTSRHRPGDSAVHAGNGVSPPREVARCRLGMAGTDRVRQRGACRGGTPPAQVRRRSAVRAGAVCTGRYLPMCLGTLRPSAVPAAEGTCTPGC